MTDSISKTADLPTVEAGNHDESSQRLLIESWARPLPGKGAEQTKAADDGLDKSADFIVSVISKNGNFANSNTRKLIGGAFQSANKDGHLEDLAKQVNQSLSQKNLEADFSVDAYTASDKQDKDKKLIGIDLHEDSVTDGMSLADQSNTKLQPLKEADLDPAAAKIESIISNQESLGDRDERHDIQNTFMRAKLSDLVDKLAAKVDQDLTKDGHDDFYLTKREQFKDSSGKPIPEIVLHTKQIVDSVTVPETP